MKKNLFLLIALAVFFNTYIYAQSATEPNVYIKPYCPDSGLTPEHHIAIEKSKKLNYELQEIIKQDGTFKVKLDEMYAKDCELKGADELAKTALLEEYTSLKNEVKAIKNQFNQK